MPKRLKETMIRSDFHMHTAFSTDSEEAVESMLNRAVERGLYSVCITDHMDADYPPDDEMGESAFRLDTENYFPFLLKKKKEYEERIQALCILSVGKTLIPERSLKSWEMHRYTGGCSVKRWNAFGK